MSLSLDLLVVLLLAWLLLATLQLLSGREGTDIAGSVSPSAAGREKRQEKQQVLRGEMDVVR